MQFYMRRDSSTQEKLHFSKTSTVKRTSQTSHWAVSATQTEMYDNCVFYYIYSAYSWIYHALKSVHPVNYNIWLPFAVLWVCLHAWKCWNFKKDAIKRLTQDPN